MHDDVDKVFTKALSDVQASHDSYDAKSKYGQLEGVSLTIEDECKADAEEQSEQRTRVAASAQRELNS